MKYYFKIGYTILLLGLVSEVCAQYKFHLPDKHDYTSVYLHRPARNDGFVVNASLVAMFTSGVADRSGLRLGVGLSVGYRWGDWTVTTGMDAYTARQKFNIGTSYIGARYEDYYGYGGSYYLNHYYQGDRQTSAIIALLLADVQVRFEDDILALPFTGFKIYDRYRTAALEVQYRNVLIGANIYTTDINGVTDLSQHNARGAYHTGQQISSPLYAGYTARGLIARLGWNSRLGGNVLQNFTHRKLFDTADFKNGNYNNPFVQLGVNKPYTLY